MTHITNDPKEFAADSLRGMVKAYPNHMIAVHGGVTRATTSPKGEVAVVVGGGSGHYPAFAGWVGPGMAHGAVCGNIFASPSASQVSSVVQASHNGGGTLLLFGNYAGDCLHFGHAAEQLSAKGIDTRIVTVSDDIASNSRDRRDDRRGIAGDFPVVKIAGAAAALGLPLDEVERLARLANSMTRSIGVAFGGCTLPGANEPLFVVPENRFALGLGIHGEPGISTHELLPAAEIAKLLVDAVLEEEPRGESGYSSRVVVLLNGLGATKYEELFVLFDSISRLLGAGGLTIVDQVVGEQVTSLDMAGVSLTVTYLNEELEQLWGVPADTPAYKTGVVKASGRRTVEKLDNSDGMQLLAGSDESQRQAQMIEGVLNQVLSALVESEKTLGKLDAVAGDGDHGQGMVLGASSASRVAHQALELHAGAASLLRLAGMAWSEGAGGTSGALWGAALEELAEGFSDEAAVGAEVIGGAVVSAARSFARSGGAKVGDKTMVDATEPFADALQQKLASGSDLASALQCAVQVAQSAAQATSQIVARKGRARTHGAASLGHPDPGAISFALVVEVLANAIGKQCSK